MSLKYHAATKEVNDVLILHVETRNNKMPVTILHTKHSIIQLCQKHMPLIKISFTERLLAYWFCSVRARI